MSGSRPHVSTDTDSFGSFVSTDQHDRPPASSSWKKQPGFTLNTQKASSFKFLHVRRVSRRTSAVRFVSIAALNEGLRTGGAALAVEISRGRGYEGQRTVSTSAAKTYPAPRSVRISSVCDPLGSIFRRRRPTCTSIDRSNTSS